MGGAGCGRRAAAFVCSLLAVGALRAQGVAEAVRAAEALGATTGVAAMELDGTWRCRHRPDAAFVPASNMKLVTAAAVLHGLGRDYQFHTRFELRAGRLGAIAGGDPNWIADTATAPEVMCRGLVAALQRRGVTAIRGVVLDQGRFTGPGRPPTWPQDQLDTYYCAPTGGFVLQQGTFVLRLCPRGGAAEATLIAPFVRMPIEGTIALSSTAKNAVYGAVDRGDHVHVQGRMWQRADPAEIRIAVRDPAAWFERVLVEAVAAGGVTVRADADAIDAPDLYEYRTPLAASVQRMLEDSSNFDAEQCARVLGAERGGDGSIDGGVAAIGRVLADLLGGPPRGLVQVDGSGLSRGNSVTPELLVRVLRAVAATPESDLYFGALPLAARTGTLAERFARSPVAGRVRAKTGWIRGASSLSGVLTRRDGSRCAFAILMNYDPAANGLNKQLKELQERIVEALDARGDAGGG